MDARRFGSLGSWIWRRRPAWFYRDMPEQRRRTLTAAQGINRYFDWQRLRREVLEPLRAGSTARYHPFDWRAGSGLADRVVEVAPTPIVIDGVYTARPELRDVIDLAVLVDTPADERQRRLMARAHGNDDWWPRWNAAEALYFETICPRSSFDLIVPGN